MFNQANHFQQNHQSENEVVVQKFCVPTYDVTFEAGEGNFEAPTAPIEIGLIPYNGWFWSISENNRLYDPFYYTLMLSYGYEGIKKWVITK